MANQELDREMQEVYSIMIEVFQYKRNALIDDSTTVKTAIRNLSGQRPPGLNDRNSMHG